jgi:hypothetical protein
VFSLVFHDVTQRAQRLATDSIIPAAHVQAIATIKTAPVRANCAVVAQIPSGRANKKPNPTATAPAQAVETRLALKSAQQGPIMSKPIRMIRDPRSESTAATSNMRATLNLQNKRRVLSATCTNIVAGPQGCRT